MSTLLPYDERMHKNADDARRCLNGCMERVLVGFKDKPRYAVNAEAKV
jgi:hypothetical protein